MRKLSIDETWDYTKRMWYWIAIRKEVCGDGRDVQTLKAAWLEENASEFVHMEAQCFFCEAHQNSCNKTCPASLVKGQGPFDCCNTAHHYEDEPGAFYREILRLDAIRTAEPVVVEHEWKEGDVFRCYTGEILVYVKDNNRDPHVFGVTKSFTDECLVDVNIDESAAFLFNIEDKL